MPLCGVGWGITLLNGIGSGNHEIVRMIGHLDKDALMEFSCRRDCGKCEVKNAVSLTECFERCELGQGIECPSVRRCG